jgi:hypothetical protein
MGEVNIRRIELLNIREVKKLVDKYPNDMELGKEIRELFIPTQAEKAYLEYWTCEWCGKHTHEVEYDYIGAGTNHLQCELERVLKLQDE